MVRVFAPHRELGRRVSNLPSKALTNKSMSHSESEPVKPREIYPMQMVSFYILVKPVQIMDQGQTKLSDLPGLNRMARVERIFRNLGDPFRPEEVRH